MSASNPSSNDESQLSAGTVLLTGASRGIGRACCIALADAGYQTVSLSRTAPSETLATDTHYAVDLSDLSATHNVVKSVLNKHTITALICNAGRGDIGSLETFSAAQIQQSITFNLISPLCIARQCLAELRARDRSDIVFIGSVSALQGGRYGTVYSASKFGLRGVAQALSHEVAAANCHVGIVHPGMVRTEFFTDLEFGPGPEDAHALQAEDVAKAVVSLLDSADNAVISELIVQPRQHVVQKRKKS